jgi:hypothetical protein
VRVNEGLLERKVADLFQKTEDLRPWGIRRADQATSLNPQMLALNFFDKWLSLSRYNSLAD